MTVLDTVKGLIAAHGANAVGAFTVADIQAMADYIEANEFWHHAHESTALKGCICAWCEDIRQARRKLGIGLAEKEAGRG